MVLRLSTFPSDVRGVGLAGLSTSTNAAITAADNVLSAFGKLQAQITAVSATAAAALPKSGGTMTGAITLSADPASALQPATKQYVDARIATTIAANNTFANTTYTNIFPGQTFNDGLQGTNIITSSSPVLGQYTGLAGYVRSQQSQSSGNQNGVALFGAASAEVNGAAVWGVNTLLQDSASRAIGSGTGRILIGYEVDINVMCPGTQIIGCSVGGNGLSQPGSSNGYIVNSLGSGIKWGGGFVTEDGAANYALAIGASSAVAGANYSSQIVAFSFYDKNSAKQSATIQMTSVPGTAEGDFLIGGSVPVALTMLNGNINITNAGFLTIGGNTVVGPRVTGMGAVTGGSNLAFNAATATLQQTAGAAAYALQVLINHGLLGP